MSRDLLTAAVAALRTGRPVLVSDDVDREDEADLILPARGADPAWIGFMIRHTSGMLCVPMSAERAAHLGLPAMVSQNQDPKGTAYTVSCDAVGVGTGIGAADRAFTADVLADPASSAAALSRPGHVFPLVAHPDGLAARRGHTEAAVALMLASELEPVGVIAELVGEDGEALRGRAVAAFAHEHGLVHLGIHDLVAGAQSGAQHGAGAAVAAVPDAAVPGTEGAARQDTTPFGATSAPATVGTGADAATGPHAGEWGPEVALPSRFGELRARVRTAPDGDIVWITAAARPITDAAGAPWVRLHSACLTGDVFGSYRCDCGEQLAEALQRLQREPGAVLYLCGHEGRGIGLDAKLRAYALQEGGLDTVEANEALGHAADERDYAGAAAALRERGITNLRLLSNNPAKANALAAAGLDVTAVEPTGRHTHPENEDYLRTKETRMGHRFQHRNTPEQHQQNQAEQLVVTAGGQA